MHPELNIPVEPLTVKKTGEDAEIFDSIRKKWVKLTPEEWVRQHMISFLNEKLGYPASLTRSESGINSSLKLWRTDILVYDREARPLLLVECKSYTVKIDREVLYQASRYNQEINAKCVVLTNGMIHFCMVYNPMQKKFEQFFHIPEFNELISY